MNRPNGSLDVTAFEDLPEKVPLAELHSAFLHVIECAPATPRSDVLTCLWELADRQWHRYRRLHPQVRQTVEDFLIAQIAADMTLDEVEQMLGIIGNLGLPLALQRLAARAANFHDAAIQPEIEDTLREFGDTVDDPYSSFRS